MIVNEIPCLICPVHFVQYLGTGNVAFLPVKVEMCFQIKANQKQPIFNALLDILRAKFSENR